MRVLICGGRDYGMDAYSDLAVHQRDLVNRVVRQLPPGTIVRDGKARGADTLAHRAATEYRDDLVTERYPADWRRHGNAAGLIRNTQMIADGDVDLVIAFAGGTGTADMVRKALGAGIPVWEPDFDERELADVLRDASPQ